MQSLWEVQGGLGFWGLRLDGLIRHRFKITPAGGPRRVGSVRLHLDVPVSMTSKSSLQGQSGAPFRTLSASLLNDAFL